MKSYDAFPAWSVDCMDHIKKVYEAPENNAPLLDLVHDNESEVTGFAVQKGRPIAEAFYPCLAIELLDEDDPFVATGYSREITVNLNIIVATRVLGGTNHEATAQREDYIGRLASVAKALLNRPQNLQFPGITVRGDSNFDSGTGKISYGFLHQGSVRAAQFPWFCKFWWTPAGPNEAAAALAA